MSGLISRRAIEFFEKIRRKFSSRIEEPRTSPNRFKHIVRPGETIDRIARVRLGDERLAGLIITINRSSIIFDRNGVAITMPGTPLDIPATDEVRVYKDNFLRGLQRRRKRPRISVNKQFLGQLEIKPVDSFTVEVETQPDTIIALSEGCRMVFGEKGAIQNQFSVKLQAAYFNGYMTIAAYESILGMTHRIIFKPEGKAEKLNVDLPVEVAIEMAKRDFHRNWKKYYDDYFLTPSATVKI